MGIVKGFPNYRQLDSMDCGPTCLRMVAAYYGKSYSLPYLREKCYLDREGVSIRGISEAAENIGFRTLAVKIPFWEKRGTPSLREAPLPSILHWNQNHFVVIYRLSKTHAWISDPSSGRYKLSLKDFKRSWITEQGQGIAMLLEPTPNFSSAEGSNNINKGLSFLIQYLKPHRRLLIQVVLGLLLGSVFQLIVPFLTQSLVDIGIDTRNLNFIYLILVGQLMVFLGQTTVQFIQNWILLHISVRMNVNLIADFLIKLMRLPLGFFDSKHTGDLLQRIGDHRRIEQFLTQSTLSVLLSSINLIVFGLVLLAYSIPIFTIFIISSALYVTWIVIFLKKRREVDYRAFQQLSDNQDSLIEIIQGMPEIKLQGSQLKRRWKWAGIQAKYFRTQMQSLAITQYQDAGALSINQLKDIFITFIAAKSVVDGQITLGMMLAIQYIIGQLNGPLQQMIAFIRTAQDAKISLERLAEIHSAPDEENSDLSKSPGVPVGDIKVEGLSFRYNPISEIVLENNSFTIPQGKTTAIVGTSGSGKTTLIKLLLGFYEPSEGSISVGSQPLNTIHRKHWKATCGVVMQDGYIFSDSVAANIAESDDKVDMSKVILAARVANLMDLVDGLPLGFQTMIGARGNGLSQGQKQRLLIARAVYKNPEFLFFDEATNALDAKNERVIMKKLNKFLVGKTTLIVAHRLSTVQNADQIIVLNKGKIVEIGNHQQLITMEGSYYELVKNQLALGN